MILATEYHLGTLKAKLAKYRGQLLEPTGKKGEKGEGFDVLKSGDARVAMIGFPSVGKVICGTWDIRLACLLIRYVFENCIRSVIKHSRPSRFSQIELAFTDLYLFS